MTNPIVHLAGALRAMRRWSCGLLATFLVLSAGLVLSVGAVPALAQPSADNITFIRIATGPTAGTYFPMGGLIANAISNPPGSRSCEKGGSCGVPGLIAVAQSTHGAVDNVDAIGRGAVELALAQADVAYWAYHGTGLYQKQGAVANLRAVAMLYQEAFHLVARKGSGIEKVTDLKGKVVSIGEKGSGTLVDALAILNAYGLTTKQIKARYLKPGASADALLAGEVDAFVFVAGPPIATIAKLVEAGVVDLIPIDGEPARKLTDAYPFLLQGEIPAGAYPGQPAIPTIAVGAVLVCSSSLPEDMVYGITRALWHPNNVPLFTRGSVAAGQQMDPHRATKGIGIPLHAGAANYYFDAGLME